MVEVSSILTLLGIVSIGLVTPGPNNLTALIHAGLHGPRSNARLIVGMATGFILLQILVALRQSIAGVHGARAGLAWCGRDVHLRARLGDRTTAPGPVRALLDPSTGVQGGLRDAVGERQGMGFRHPLHDAPTG